VPEDNLFLSSTMPAAGVDSTGLAVGLKKGFLVEKRVMKQKPSQRRKEGKHVAFVRGIIREIAGYSPLERRGMELLKNGRDKRVLKLCKKRVRAPNHSSQGGMGCGQLLRLEGARRVGQAGCETWTSSCTLPGCGVEGVQQRPLQRCEGQAALKQQRIAQVRRDQLWSAGLHPLPRPGLSVATRAAWCSLSVLTIILLPCAAGDPQAGQAVP